MRSKIPPPDIAFICNPQVSRMPQIGPLEGLQMGFIYTYAVLHPETREAVVIAGQLVDRKSWNDLYDVGADNVWVHMLRLHPDAKPAHD